MSAADNNPLPLYLDCDTGIDDAVALALLLASPEVDLCGIGTVSGNVSADQAATNTRNLLWLAGRAGVPVAVGADNASTAVPHIHGANGVGDVHLAASPEPHSTVDAADLLIRLSYQYPGRLRVLALGPLTNLAVALGRDPGLPGRIAGVTVMGGAARGPGNISAVAEANIGNDPAAARRVFEAPWQLTLVPLDVTLTNRLEETDRRALAGSGRPVARALGQMLDRYFDFYVSVYGRRCAALHDPLAAAIAIGRVRPALAPKVSVTIDDTHSGHEREGVRAAATLSAAGDRQNRACTDRAAITTRWTATRSAAGGRPRWSVGGGSRTRWPVPPPRPRGPG